MSANLNVVRSTSKRILLVIANSATSTTVGGPVGFWAAELTHAYYEFVERGYEVTPVRAAENANWMPSAIHAMRVAIRRMI